MKSVIVKKTKRKDKGVFAAREFKKGEIILKWHPKILSSYQSQQLGSKLKHYLCQISKNRFYLMQPPERYINHSCDSNSRVKGNTDVAIQHIRIGDEITSDYGKSFLGFKCKCGSKNCRGTI